MKYVRTPWEANQISYEEAEAVLRRPRTHPELLALFRNHPDAKILVLLCQNPSTPSTVLHEISSVYNRDVFKAISDNPNLSKETAETVALACLNNERRAAFFLGDPVISCFEKYPESFPIIEGILTKSENDAAVVAVAKNIHTPVDILKNLILPSGKVGGVKAVYSAASNPSLSVEHMRPYDEATVYWAELCGYAANPNTTIEHIKRSASSENWTVRFAVMSHPKFPAELFETLKTDENDMVRNRAFIQAPPEGTEDMPAEWVEEMFNFRPGYFNYNDFIRSAKNKHERNVFNICWREKYLEAIRVRYNKN